MTAIRPCTDQDGPEILEIINAAAQAYRGVIPADCWHEPYMPEDELDREIDAGVHFIGYEMGGALAGVMGLQPLPEVDLLFELVAPTRAAELLERHWRIPARQLEASVVLASTA